MTPALLHADALIWEQHCCLALAGEPDVDALLRYRRAGASFVSVNVGYAPHDAAATLHWLQVFRGHLQAHPEDYVLAATVDDVLAARADGRLAVAFDLEDTTPLSGDLGNVERFYDLGVRTMLMTYNGRNAAGAGCHDDPEVGLTAWGRAVVAEMNRVGMVVDATHCSLRTSLDLCELSATPVVCSHSGARAVWDHERNLTDDQLRAVAGTGGVIGVPGVGVFLGANDTSTATFVRHVDHIAELVGPQHVGIGLDFVFDGDDLNRELRENPQLFPPAYSRYGRIDFVPPEQLPEITAALLDRGYGEADVRGVLGENFLRVARTTWR